MAGLRFSRQANAKNGKRRPSLAELAGRSRVVRINSRETRDLPFRVYGMREAAGHWIRTRATGDAVIESRRVDETPVL